MTVTGATRQSPADADRSQVDFYRTLEKTKLCSFYLSGSCRRGRRCQFAHGAHELVAAPDLAKTKLCRYKDYYNGCRDPNCRFAHSEFELQVLPDEADKGPTAEDGGSTNHTSSEMHRQEPDQVEVDEVVVFQPFSGDLQGWVSFYEARLHEIMSDLEILSCETLRSSGLDQLLSQRCKEFAGAAQRQDPLPTLNPTTIHLEAQLLSVLVPQHYED